MKSGPYVWFLTILCLISPAIPQPTHEATGKLEIAKHPLILEPPRYPRLSEPTPPPCKPKPRRLKKLEKLAKHLRAEMAQ